VTFQFIEEMPAVELGHQHIEQDHVRNRPAAHAAQGLHAVGRRHDMVARLSQCIRKIGSGNRIVFHHQDSTFGIFDCIHDS
jgi:hypothetical protein